MGSGLAKQDLTPSELANFPKRQDAPMLKITVAQLNYTIGDIEGNVARMTAAADVAAREQADLVVFSELSLTGYYPADLLDEPEFLERAAQGLERLREAT